MPTTYSLEDIDDRDFAEDVVVLSSFAYRIDAIRLSTKIQAADLDMNPSGPVLQGLDALVTNWWLHLPDCKRVLLREDGSVDEMLFQAHMVAHLCVAPRPSRSGPHADGECSGAIFLHRPRSSLAFRCLEDRIECVFEQKYALPTKSYEYHTAKAIHGANAISDLITLPTPLLKHTSLISCMVTLGAIVHLSACSFVLSGEEAHTAKERIRLALGALKGLEKVWSFAASVQQQLKRAAREVFNSRKSMDASKSGLITEEEMMTLMDTDYSLHVPAGIDYAGLLASKGNPLSVPGL